MALGYIIDCDGVGRKMRDQLGSFPTIQEMMVAWPGYLW